MASRSPSPTSYGRRGSTESMTPKTPGATDLSGGAPPKRFLNGWTKEQETLMAEWADVASCYRWLHDRAEKIFSRSNMMITIPVIILSTLTGTANFAVDSFIPEGDPGTKKYVAAGIGAVSIFAGILSTLGNFFQYAQKSESHKVAGINWGKFQRQVTVELAIHPNERIDAMDFLKICRQDLDRLIEQSPPIPDAVIAAFEKEFKTIPNLKVPDICHGIEHTRVYDASKSRLAKITADAALHLKYRKGVLKDTILPDIDRKIQTELNSRIEQRIRDLMPAPAPPPPQEVTKAKEGLTLIVSNLETDWRKLLMSRKNLMIPTEPAGTGIVAPTVRPMSMRIAKSSSFRRPSFVEPVSASAPVLKQSFSLPSAIQEEDEREEARVLPLTPPSSRRGGSTTSSTPRSTGSQAVILNMIGTDGPVHDLITPVSFEPSRPFISLSIPRMAAPAPAPVAVPAAVPVAAGAAVEPVLETVVEAVAVEPVIEEVVQEVPQEAPPVEQVIEEVVQEAPPVEAVIEVIQEVQAEAQPEANAEQVNQEPAPEPENSQQ